MTKEKKNKKKKYKETGEPRLRTLATETVQKNWKYASTDRAWEYTAFEFWSSFQTCSSQSSKHIYEVQIGFTVTAIVSRTHSNPSLPLCKISLFQEDSKQCSKCIEGQFFYARCTHRQLKLWQKGVGFVKWRWWCWASTNIWSLISALGTSKMLANTAPAGLGTVASPWAGK